MDEKYLTGRFYGSDSKLGLYLLEQLRAVLGQWHERIKNTFGTEVMHIELQSGRMDGSIDKKKYFKSYKKDFSKRNGSDCMSSVFSSRAEMNFVGLEDMREYADFIASNDELLYQNSHTQVEMIKLQSDGEEMEKTIDIKAVEKQLAATVDFYDKIKTGKIPVSKETVNATKIIMLELCSTVSEWANENQNKEGIV